MKLNSLILGPTGPCGVSGPRSSSISLDHLLNGRLGPGLTGPLQEYIDHADRNETREMIMKELKGISLNSEQAKYLLASFMVDEAMSLVQIKQLLFKLKHDDKPPIPPKTEEDVRGWLHLMTDRTTNAKDVEKVEIDSKLEVDGGHLGWKIPETVNRIPVKFKSAAHIDAEQSPLKSLEGCPTSVYSLRISQHVKTLKGIPKHISILILKFWWNDKAEWTFVDLAKQKVHVTEKLVIGHLNFEDFINMKPLALMMMSCPKEIEIDDAEYTEEGKKMGKIWQIIKKHWQEGGDIIDAQHELIEKGFEEATKL